MKVGGAFGLNNDDAAEFIQYNGMTAAQVQYDGSMWGSGGFIGKLEAIGKWEVIGKNVDLYVHAQFDLNPCDATKRGWYLKQYQDTCEFAMRVGAKGIVLHPGSRKEDSEHVAFVNLCAFMEKVIGKTNMVTLLETDAGDKRGRKIGSPKFLVEVCGKIGSPLVRMCLDTAHLYARGWEVWDKEVRMALIRATYPYAALVHLNIPDPTVNLGGFLDRHKISFSDYQHDSVGFIQDFVGMFPCILERGSEAQQLDMQMIKSVMIHPLGITK